MFTRLSTVRLSKNSSVIKFHEGDGPVAQVFFSFDFPAGMAWKGKAYVLRKEDRKLRTTQIHLREWIKDELGLEEKDVVEIDQDNLLSMIGQLFKHLSQ